MSDFELFGNLGFLLANLGILWINIKLYSEVLKDRNSELRRRQDRERKSK